MDDDSSSIILYSTKGRSVDLLREVFKIRPDLIRIEIVQNLDVEGMNRLFLQLNLGGNIQELCFKRFMWYDERAEVLGQFFIKNKTVKRLEILTVNDCNRGLTAVLDALVHNKSIIHYKLAMNTLGQESILFFTKILQDNRRIEILDLSYL